MAKIFDFINHGCYPGYTLFSVGFPYEDLLKILKTKKYSQEGVNFWYEGLAHESELFSTGKWFALKRVIENKSKGLEKNLTYIIITEKFNYSDYDYCKLAHECMHIEQFFMQDILDRDKETEACAYFHTHLMEQCLKIIRKAK